MNNHPKQLHRKQHWFRQWCNKVMLWELRHSQQALVVFGIITVLMIWQGSKLPKRLRGGLINIPGSESELVLHHVEEDFSKALAFPTILVQEGLGSINQLEDSWKNAIDSVKKLPEVHQVIDMHLGREIVAEIQINTKSFFEAQEMLRSLQENGLPEQCSISQTPKVAKDGGITLAIETDVRSFKEGDSRRKLLEEALSQLKLPPGSHMELKVTRHPRRNFAMVESDVDSYQKAESLTANLQKSLGDIHLPTGKNVHVTGLPALFYDLNQEAVAAMKKAEWIGIPICFLLLILVFGSPAAAILPIIVAVIALATGSAVMSKVGKYIEISMFVPSVLSMIGLGVGVDYMLILLSRFRECMPKHSTVDEAIMEAMHLAAPTLIGSGFTVAIGFSALIFTPVMLFRAMGIAGIVVIISALLCIFLLSPVLFKIASRHIVWNKPPEPRPSFWKKWTHIVVERPLICLACGLCLMLFIASPAKKIQTATLNPDAVPAKLESKKGYNICKNSFGPGWLMPAVIVIEKTPLMSEEDYLKKEEKFIADLRALDDTFDAVGASDLSSVANRGFNIEIPSNFFNSKSGKRHLILAMYDGNPLSIDGRKWVEDLKVMAHSAWPKDVGLSAHVGGVVASTLDLDEAVKIYLVRTAIFCFATTLVCLAFFYRSILIPLQAITMNLLSVSAAYGFLVLWYQKGLGAKIIPSLIPGPQGVNSIVILLLFCALFGLSMDYQVFLISRMAEEWNHSRNNKLAVRRGIELTGRVVTGAAAIMITIFLSFAFVSVQETRQFGTGMAAAITFDATIIRLLVFPSSMLLVGQSNWWWPFSRKVKMPGHPASISQH
jgi:RND superfamily putative drug exporter